VRHVRRGIQTANLSTTNDLAHDLAIIYRTLFASQAEEHKHNTQQEPVRLTKCLLCKSCIYLLVNVAESEYFKFIDCNRV